MATRLYFDTQVPSLSPTFDGSWEVTGSAVRRWLVPEKVETHALESLAVATNSNTPAGAVDVLIAQYVTAPLSGAQTIAGDIKAIVRATESSTSADMRAQTVIWVRTSAGAVRGTLIASSAAALASEFASSPTNRKFPLAWTGTGATPTSVAAQDGDRIIVELGYRKHESATTSRTGTLSLGNPTGTDNAEDETTSTANTPWIEFADNLVFQATEARVSQTVAEALYVPSTVAARVSQTVVEVLYPSSNPTTPLSRPWSRVFLIE